jgi:hypothetical protein
MGHFYPDFISHFLKTCRLDFKFCKLTLVVWTLFFISYLLVNNNFKINGNEKNKNRHSDYIVPHFHDEYFTASDKSTSTGLGELPVFL